MVADRVAVARPGSLAARWLFLAWLGLLSLAVAADSGAQSSGQTPASPPAAPAKPSPLTLAIREALARPNDAAALNRVLDLLPRVELPNFDFSSASGDAKGKVLSKQPPYYVWQGDLLLRREEVADHIALLRLPKETSDRNPELTVNVNRMKNDLWPPDNRKLTYAIDRKSFPRDDGERRYRDVVRWMEEASRDWVEACGTCGLSFTHNRLADDLPSVATSTFIVQYTDSSNTFAAAAFFPSTIPSRRILYIDKTFFDTAYVTRDYSPQGILRHELGHVIGFRHEHIHGTAGCERFSETDGDFRLLSAQPDIESIMHYRCGGASGPDKLSKTDIEELQKVYNSAEKRRQAAQAYEKEQEIREKQLAFMRDDQIYTGAITRANMPTGARFPGKNTGYREFKDLDTRPNEIVIATEEARVLRQDLPPVEEKLSITFEGGDVPRNVALLLRRLIDRKVVGTTQERVRPGDTACKLFLAQLSLPTSVSCSDEMKELVRYLNPDLKSIESLTVGQSLRVPKAVPITAVETREFFNPKLKSQQVQLEDKLRTSRPWIIEKTEDQILSREFELVLGLNEAGAAARLGAELRQMRLKDVMINSNDPLPGVRYSVDFDLGKCPAQAANLPVRKKQDGPFKYVSLLSAEENACVAQCQSVVKKIDGKDVTVDLCPHIYFPDQPVEPVRDLRAPLALATTPGAADSDDCLTEAKFDSDRHHGTHLASIMVGSGAPSGFRGLAPSARLHTDIDWRTDLSFGQAIKSISKTQVKGEKSLIVFASRFAAYPPDMLESGGGGLLQEEGNRLQLATANALAKSNVVLIAAVGQPKQKENPDYFDMDSREIVTRSAYAPANLGDLPNIIIATACDNCSDKDASLLGKTHYSHSRLVSLAAPGVNIPGLIDKTSFAYGTGTSQAAAYVGGVAAAMITCAPLAFDQPGSVKERLLVTARAVFASNEAKKLATGIIDPAVAVLDPTKIWFRRINDPKWESREPSDATAWCAKDVSLLNPVGITMTNGFNATSSLLRLSRFTREQGTNHQRWVFFRRESDDGALGSIAVIGPGKSNRVDSRLMRFGANDYIKMADIDDLILPNQIDKVVDDCGR